MIHPAPPFETAVLIVIAFWVIVLAVFEGIRLAIRLIGRIRQPVRKDGQKYGNS